MFGKLITNILMCFMKPRVDGAVEQLRNDPDIKKKFKDLENALQDLKDATDRKNALYNSPEYIELTKKFGRQDAFGQKYGPKAKDK